MVNIEYIISLCNILYFTVKYNRKQLGIISISYTKIEHTS